MASVHFTQKDYDVVVQAIYDLLPRDKELAEQLDAFAKKMNSALSVARYKGVPKYPGMEAVAPSPLETLRRLEQKSGEAGCKSQNTIKEGEHE